MEWFWKSLPDKEFLILLTKKSRLNSFNMKKRFSVPHCKHTFLGNVSFDLNPNPDR